MSPAESQGSEEGQGGPGQGDQARGTRPGGPGQGDQARETRPGGAGESQGAGRSGRSATAGAAKGEEELGFLSVDVERGRCRGDASAPSARTLPNVPPTSKAGQPRLGACGGAGPSPTALHGRPAGTKGPALKGPALKGPVAMGPSGPHGQGRPVPGGQPRRPSGMAQRGQRIGSASWVIQEGQPAGSASWVS